MLALISVMFNIKIGVLLPERHLIRIISDEGDCDVILINNGEYGAQMHYSGTGIILKK